MSAPQASALSKLAAGEHGDPHRLLGHHDGTIRSLRPGAVAMRVVLPDGTKVPMKAAAPAGVFEAAAGDDEVAHLADAWERHNAFAFLEGYAAAEGIDELLPEDEDDRAVVRRAFELEKAVYEVRYERAHRPEWVGIPLSAVRRLASA